MRKQSIGITVVLVSILWANLCKAQENEIKLLEPENSYEFSKCVEFDTRLRRSMSYEEICKYGQECPAKKTDDEIEMLCRLSTVGECFEEKAWVTFNQFIGLSNDIKVESTFTRLSIVNGVRKSKTCAHYGLKLD